MAIRYVNSRYAAWYNKKEDRIGPLWQGRFKSWYVHGEDYFWLLIRYLELNPVRAGLEKGVGDFVYSASHFVVHGLPLSVLIGSSLYQKDIQAWMGLLDVNELVKLDEYQAQPLAKGNAGIEVMTRPELREYFSVDMCQQQRNFAIYKAFVAGHKQTDIGRYLGMSTAAVSRIVDQVRQLSALFLIIRDKGLFWSYSPTIEFGPDKQKLLIETVLKFADIDDIRQVFRLCGKRTVAAVWNERIRHDSRFKKLNYFLARIFFDMELEADQLNEVRHVRAEKLRLLAG